MQKFSKKPLEWIGYLHRKTFEEKHNPLKWLCITTTTAIAFGEPTTPKVANFFSWNSLKNMVIEPYGETKKFFLIFC
jgi:hypothetical protein